MHARSFRVSRNPSSASPLSGRPVRFRPGWEGLFLDEFEPASAWIREAATVEMPSFAAGGTAVIHGDYLPHPAVRGIEAGPPALTVRADGAHVATVRPAAPGPFQVSVPLNGRRTVIGLRLEGVALTNAFAWLGRVTGLAPFQRFRAQNRNRQLRIRRIEVDGEAVYDFANRHAPRNLAVTRRYLQVGLNIAGYLTADLGIGESARCMVRAADAAGLPSALIDLKLPVKSPRNDDTYRPRLQAAHPHAVNVVHLDPPAAHDLDHHHPGFRAGKHNIGYWAWELPEFPDAWTPYFAYFDEIWCPSEFVREAVTMKSPVPVIAMPHAIAFPRPAESVDALRARFGLPAGPRLFLFAYDLHSYSARKNPQGVLAAFRASGLAPGEAALVIKTHGAAGNEADLAALRAAVADLPGTILLTDTLSRADLYRLQAACDCFVSLHRSEGFGLAVAECMYLGKPVIATGWSATAEYLDETNGCPVRHRLVTLDRNHGPYARGQTWAEPDVAHAGEWMRRLCADPALAARLGAAARRTIEEKFSPAAVGARYRRRLEAIANW